MDKKNIVEVIEQTNSITDLDRIDNMIYELKCFEIITYKEYITLVDLVCERKEQIY